MYFYSHFNYQEFGKNVHVPKAHKHFYEVLLILRVTFHRPSFHFQGYTQPGCVQPESVGCVLNFRGCKQLSDELQASFDSKAAFLVALEA